MPVPAEPFFHGVFCEPARYEEVGGYVYAALFHGRHEVVEPVELFGVERQPIGRGLVDKRVVVMVYAQNVVAGRREEVCELVGIFLVGIICLEAQVVSVKARGLAGVVFKKYFPVFCVCEAVFAGRCVDQPGEVERASFGYRFGGLERRVVLGVRDERTFEPFDRHGYRTEGRGGDFPVGFGEVFYSCGFQIRIIEIDFCNKEIVGFCADFGSPNRIGGVGAF